MKYVVYLRVSTDRQDLQAQRSLCMGYIQANGGGEHVEYIDEDVSGSLKMEDRDNMFDAIESLKPGDVFLIDTRDRLGRDTFFNIVTSRKIVEKGAKLTYVSQNMSGMDAGSIKLMETILDAFAEFELYQIGMRTRKRLKEIKKSGFRVGRVPYGYKLGQAVEHTVMTSKGEEKKISYKITKDLTESQILDEMKKLNESGESVRGIAERLNKAGKTTRAGGLWSHVSIHKILKNADSHKRAYE